MLYKGCVQYFIGGDMSKQITKHPKVTEEDRARIREITAPPVSGDTIQEKYALFFQSLKDAEAYLRDHVEELGLFEYATGIIGCTLPGRTPNEGLVAAPMFLELNNKVLSSTPLIGDIADSHAE